MKLVQSEEERGVRTPLTDAQIEVEHAVLMLQVLLKGFDFHIKQLTSTRLVLYIVHSRGQHRAQWTSEIHTIFEGTEAEVARLAVLIPDDMRPFIRHPDSDESDSDVGC